MTGTSQKTSGCGTVTGVGFMLIDAVLCLQSQFEDCTFCIDQEYCHLYAFSSISSPISPNRSKVLEEQNFVDNLLEVK